ncbi:MAG: CHAD domain-containing protein [Actinomycetota bacterium]
MNTPLTADSPLWAWASDAVGHRLDKMLEHVEGVRLGEDIEAVHDMRVGSRRLVAAMRVFAECFPAAEYRRLLREARNVTRRLGAVRDLDVLIDHYEKLRPEASAAEQPGIDYFIALRQRERVRARRPMLRAMDQLERDGFAQRLRSYLEREAELYQVGLDPYTIRLRSMGSRLEEEPAAAIGSFRHAAPPALEVRHAELYAFEPYVDHPEAVEELHEMRIAAKWLRYTMELFAPAYADGLKRPLSSVKRIQELLGDLHDSDVRLDLLRGMVDARLDYRGLEAIGRLLPDPVERAVALLLEREEVTRQGCYQAFYKEWSRLEVRGFREKCLERVRKPDA